MPRILTEEELDQIRARDKARTPGVWHACGDGKCQCKHVWASDHPIAQVEHGEWGDSYPALRLVGSDIKIQAEPYIGLIPYGDIPEDIATANSIFIAGCSEDIPNLLTTIDAKEQELIETRGQRDRAQNKLDEIRRQEAALPGTTELQRHIRELERMIPELQRRQKRHIEHIAGLERNNHELREQLTQLKGMSTKINQTKNYMKSPEEIMREVDDSYKRDSLKYSDLLKRKKMIGSICPKCTSYRVIFYQEGDSVLLYCFNCYETIEFIEPSEYIKASIINRECSWCGNKLEEDLIPALSVKEDTKSNQIYYNLLLCRDVKACDKRGYKERPQEPWEEEWDKEHGEGVDDD